MTDNFYAPPHSIEAEQAVIGGLLLDDDSSERVQKVLAMLKPDSFYSRPHKILFEEITRMHREQKPVDGLTLFDELERKSLTASVGGFAYIAEIAKNTPSAANIVAYAMQVRETAMERYAINRMTEATELLYSRNGMTATQKYEAIQSIFTQLTDHAKTGSRRGLRSFGEVMEDWVSDLEKRFDPSGEQRGMSTGIPSLDRMLSPKGLVKGSLFVIGARPKMGKTTLYSQMAINCAVHEKKPALMFSLEMPGDQILEKLVGQKSGVNPNIFYLPATNDADDGKRRSRIKEPAGINHIAGILTPQNVKAISRYSSELGRIADAYGTLARAAVKPQQYIERTGRTANVLRDLDAGLSNVTSTVLNAIANSTSGAIVGGAGGGIAGAAAGALVGAGLKGAVSKIATTRSGRYAIEKAVQEATKAVRAGGSKEALAAAERRFMANKAAVKAIRDAIGSDEFNRLSRAGIVASLSGMNE